MQMTSSILMILWVAAIGLIVYTHRHPAPQVSEADEKN